MMKARFLQLALIACPLLSLAAAEAPAAPAPTGPLPHPLRVYSHLLEPREHPDDDRRAVKPPDWDTFDHRPQFTVLRGFNVEGPRIVGFAEEMEKYTKTHQLGDVVWPSYPILFATNLADLAREIKARQLYLFDVWGYVPGSGPGGYWQQFKVPHDALAMLEHMLGKRWLGTDIGEQDGRYIGGYADQMTPASADRFAQYLNFQQHFERMGDDLGHKHATLVSLNFGHYFLKEGTYTLIGAETAQGLPNSQVYYAFIRGAGKQYGVPWFGNASIYNRWGFKTYGSAGKSDGYEFGPTKGTSLSLMKRLLYSHLLYNSVAVGFENGWFEGDRLSPIGRIQQAAQRWVKANGPPGVLYTPVAVLLDFNAGWTFPRHLYTDKLYRVWGNLPYARGDYLTDAVLDLLYPGYADASYFHDETGFLTPTPCGDIADCLLGDAPLWLLQRYPVVILAGHFVQNVELVHTLERYVESGGHLIEFEGPNRALGGLDPSRMIVESAIVKAGPAAFHEPPLELYGIMHDTHETVLAELREKRPIHEFTQEVVVQRAQGRGRRTTFLADHGLTSSKTTASLTSAVDQPLARPFPMLGHVRHLLLDLLRAEALFDAGHSNLHLITCRRAPGEYTVGLFNNTWRPLPFRLSSRGGPITSLRELPLDQSEKEAVGYTPEGIDAAQLGGNTDTTIAGGDVRLFAVQIREAGVEEIAHVRPPPRPHDRFLTLRRLTSIKEAILARPTFFQHWDGVCVDWRYLHDHESAALAREAGWIRRQGLRVCVDLSSGIDLYPALRLIDNLEPDYAASMAAISNVLAKMEIVGARDLILSLHRHPENNFTGAQTDAAFENTLQDLARQAAARQVTLHLRLAFGKPPWGLEAAGQWLDRVGVPNLKIAASTALLGETKPTPAQRRLLNDKLGLWLLAAARSDAAGKVWDAHAPLADVREPPSIAEWMACVPEAPRVSDALLNGTDHEYLERLDWERAGLTPTPPSPKSD